MRAPSLTCFRPVNGATAITKLRRSMFPPVNSGGLIEACKRFLERLVLVGAEFPPVNSGGLIEASFLGV